MKKLILFIILILLSTTNIKAYENDYFKIDVPEQYKQSINEENLYKWEYKNNYISVTISDNTELGYDIKSYTDDNIQEQKKYLESNINNSLENYNIKVSVTDIKKIELKEDLYSLNYTIYWPTKELTGYDTYQIGNVISSDKYIITIIYSIDNDQTEEYNKIINTLEIKDTITNAKNSRQITIILIVLIAAFFTVLRLTIKYKRTK